MLYKFTVFLLCTGVLGNELLDISNSTSSTPSLELEIWPRTDDGIITVRDHNGFNDYQKYIDDLNTLTEGYNTAPDPLSNIVKCSYDKPKPPNTTCHVEPSWSPCIKDNNYSYHNASPCIFIKLKPAENWSPSAYSNLKDLPDNMPDKLKQTISDYYNINKNCLKNLWISCEGDTPTDIEYIGPVQYLPTSNIASYHFPRNTNNYQYPVIAVQLQKPRSGYPVAITCTAWTRDLVATANFHVYLP